MKWINVNDALPEDDNIKVLWWDSLRKDYFIFSLNAFKGKLPKRYTHWKTLPEPPNT